MSAVRPIRRFVLLLDDQPEQADGGVVVRRDGSRPYLDHVVVAVGAKEAADFGPGDRVIVADPWAGRPVMLDGVAYRLVRTSDIIARID